MNLEICCKTCPAQSIRLLILFMCTCTLLGQAQNTIYTVAGGASVAGNATAPAADLPEPSAVAVDSSGNLYIADPTAEEIFKVDTSSNLTVFAGIGYPTEHANNYNGKPANQVGINGPAGVAVDGQGNVYIADTVNYLIRVINTAGTIQNVAGDTRLCQDPTTACGDGGKATSAALNYPVGVTIDGSGNVYIADTNDNRVRVVNMGKATITVAGVTISAGTIATVAGNGTQCTNPLAGNCGDGGAATSAQLNLPQGVAVDKMGNIYISDSSDHRVRIVSSSGVISPFAGTGNLCNPAVGCGDGGAATAGNLSNPWQLSLDSTGNLFIADPPENRILEVDAATQSLNVVAGDGMSGFSGNGGLPTAAELNQPRGIAVDASDNLYVADLGNQQVRKFTLGASGSINVYAGGGSGNDGSVATSAILGGDHAVALDSAGNLYISDTANNRIREVTPSSPPGTYGTISTIVGTGIAGFYGNGRPASSAELSSPMGIVVDSSNNIDIADTGNVVIRQYNPNSGLISNIAGKPGQQCPSPPNCGDGGPATSATFVMPTSVALDSAGNLYVADPGNNNVRLVNMGSTSITVAGVTILPGDIGTVAGNGTACSNTAIGSCGDNGLATAAQLNGPFGVAVDSLGDIFIADTGDNRIREVPATGPNAGNMIAYAFNGTPVIGPFNIPALTSAFEGPYYLAVDPHGNLYVSGSDFYYIIDRIDAVSQNVNPVAGVPSDPKFFGFGGDGGLSIDASIDQFGVAIDGAGHLYVADGRNNRVREILLTPSASTSVSKLTFSPAPIGQTSSGQSFNLTNRGGDDLYLAATPVVSGPFALQSSTCSNNIVPPGLSCQLTLTSTPTGYGTEEGSITITDNAYGSGSQAVSLVGSGPDYSLTASPTSLTVTPGGEAQSTLTLAPIAGFNQTVKLSCSGTPTGASCSLSQKSVTLDGTDAVNLTLTITTSSTTQPGTYTVKANGTSVVGHAVQISLTVQ